jgi:hypothetical protein
MLQRIAEPQPLPQSHAARIAARSRCLGHPTIRAPPREPRRAPHAPRRARKAARANDAGAAASRAYRSMVGPSVEISPIEFEGKNRSAGSWQSA